MGLTRGGFDRNAWYNQRIVRTMHAALGRRFFVLLDCHDQLSEGYCAATASGQPARFRVGMYRFGSNSEL